ncbi:MAG: hypothetical protein HQL38_12590 [Alphaproteobacteria bacterium]|nr:hypothetical protein [Alphaproteobacteria bacterium]
MAADARPGVLRVLEEAELDLLAADADYLVIRERPLCAMSVLRGLAALFPEDEPAFSTVH